MGISISGPKTHNEPAAMEVATNQSNNGRVGMIAKWSPLSQAVIDGNVSKVRHLLDNPKIDINAQEEELDGNERLFTRPLDVAVRYNKEEMARFLCESGAQVNLADSKGDSPIHQACYHGHTALVRLLVSYSANVNISNLGGSSPLEIVCTTGHLDIVRELLDAGAHPNSTHVKNALKLTPLHYASEKGYADIVSLLCKHKDVMIDQMDLVHRTALMFACRNGHIRVVKSLLVAGANVNKTDNRGRTALQYAFMKCDRNQGLGQEKKLSQKASSYDILQLLIEHGARLNVLDIFGHSAAHYSVWVKGKKDCLVLLFRHGAEILPHKLTPNLLENWQDTSNVTLLAQLSPEYRPFATKVLSECCEKLCEDDVSVLREVLRCPPSLQAVCRQTIRLSLQKNCDTSIFPQIACLQLPTLCHQYLRYDHINLEFYNRSLN